MFEAVLMQVLYMCWSNLHKQNGTLSSDWWPAATSNINRLKLFTVVLNVALKILNFIFISLKMFISLQR